jgi:hypothetical protein
MPRNIYRGFAGMIGNTALDAITSECDKFYKNLNVLAKSNYMNLFQ